MLDCYFLRDEIEQQVELSLPRFSSNEQNFMDFLYEVGCVSGNVLKKSQQ